MLYGKGISMNPVVVIGGGSVQDLTIWDTITDTVTDMTFLDTAMDGMEIVEMVGEKLVAVGGDDSEADSSVYVFTTKDVEKVGTLLHKRLEPASFMIPRNYAKCRAGETLGNTIHHHY